VLSVPDLGDHAVRLRPPRPDDVDAITPMCQDPAIARFTTIPWPYEREHAVNWVDESTQHWRDGSGASFLIVDAETDEVLGSLGLVRFEPAQRVAEVGYLVKKEARGLGVAPRALALVARWTLVDLGVARLELLTDVRNRASQRVAEKAGFTREGEVDPPERCRERSQRMVMFSLAAPESAGQ
jgi:[ribosomal protein S5]-alanine N-acetyltransferase